MDFSQTENYSSEKGHIVLKRLYLAYDGDKKKGWRDVGQERIR